MKGELSAECWTAILAFLITLGYVLWPGPYQMGAFVFVAQPLFLVAFVGYTRKVIRELRSKKVL